MARFPAIALLTDYGTKDHFVASMKGVMLTVNPDLHFLDISHDITPNDILEAAFVLRCCYSTFPNRTIFVVVVDPTVGSERKPIMVATDNHYFIGPDNGVFSLIYDVEYISSVVEIQAEHYRAAEVSNTFHGRDIFGPAAAWLAKGIDMSNFGDTLENYVKLPLPKPKIVNDTILRGTVMHVDRFGNCITNITKQDYEQARAKVPGEAFKVLVSKQEINGLKQYYAEAQKGELLALFGSNNFLEISQNAGAAAKTLAINRGAEVGIQLK